MGGLPYNLAIRSGIGQELIKLTNHEIELWNSARKEAVASKESDQDLPKITVEEDHDHEGNITNDKSTTLFYKKLPKIN